MFNIRKNKKNSISILEFKLVFKISLISIRLKLVS